jgi:CRISPR type III-B/RAMP module RAMP protein Cmr6
MAKRFKPIPHPKFLTPSDLPLLDFVPPKQERQRDGVKSTNVVKTDNFGLLISRLIPFQVVRNDKEDVITEVKNDRFGNDREATYQTLRNQWFEHCTLNYTSSNKAIADLIDNSYQRWIAITEGAARFSMVARSRMIIGLGGKGTLEFGITLHPVTGLPYIPGSALKGLCRNYALYYIARQSEISLDPATVKDPSEVAKQIDEQLTEVKDHGLKIRPEYAMLYRNLFGTQKEAGQCVFFDAVIRQMPDDRSLFVVEVMTPHFRQYYESNGQKPAHDADDPNPIMFIAVSEGVRFTFAVGLRRTASVDNGILRDARQLLQEALELMGIGAKTASGYGVFAPVQKQK